MTPERSFDDELLKQASFEFNGDRFDYEGWIANRHNIMYVIGNNVGIATFDYPGCYTAHWFFKARGKEALDIAFAMYDDLFNQQGAEVVRGITPVNLRGARYLAKRIGFVSLGIETYPDGDHEIMCLTKDEFNKKQKERNGRYR
jgi:hypothetical protein